MDKRSLRKYPPLEVRFWPKVDKNGPIPVNRPELGPCWVWTGAKSKGGYGQIRTKGVLDYAHRISYEMVHGPLPKGERDHHVDHLCRNPACCNPGHLEYVTASENVRRGNVPVAVPAHYAKQTHCKHGHEYTPENTYYPPGSPTHRSCRACARDRYEKRKAA
jgi:hypothetical protein